jgi:hypothetical protein
LGSEQTTRSSAHRSEKNGHFAAQDCGQGGVDFASVAVGSHFDLEHETMGSNGMPMADFILQEAVEAEQ